MTDKQPVSKLKRRKTSLEECKLEQLHQTLPRESIGSFAHQDHPKTPADRLSGPPCGQEWTAQPGLSSLERLWALTLQAFSTGAPEHSAADLLPDLPPLHTQACAREKQAEWRWCCRGDEVGSLPELPAAASLRAPASSASSGQPAPVAPANAVPTETACLSDRAAPERPRARASAQPGNTGGGGEEEEEEERSGPVSVPTPQRCHQGGDKGQRGVGMATSRSATSSVSASSSLAAATDTRTKRRRETAAATATTGVTLEMFFSAGRGGGGGGGGGGRGAKEDGLKQRPPTDEHSGGIAAGQGASAGGQGASAQAGGAGVGGLECCPMCLMPFPAGFSQMDCDGHLAQCLSEMNTDMEW